MRGVISSAGDYSWNLVVVEARKGKEFEVVIGVEDIKARDLSYVSVRIFFYREQDNFGGHGEYS